MHAGSWVARAISARINNIGTTWVESASYSTATGPRGGAAPEQEDEQKGEQAQEPEPAERGQVGEQRCLLDLPLRHLFGLADSC